MFDSCRADFVPPDRGGIDNQKQESDGEAHEARNCVLIFGCKPLGAVSAVSTVATEFIERLRACTQPNDSITFPTISFLKWTPGDEGDVNICSVVRCDSMYIYVFLWH